MKLHFTQYKFPFEAKNDGQIIQMNNVIATPYYSGNIKSIVAPKKYNKGAIYTETGDLVTASQRIGGVSGDHFVQTDDLKILTNFRKKSLKGHYLYIGHWMGHFGHFIFETLPNLFLKNINDYHGIVAHRFCFTSEILDYQRELLKLMGVRIPIIIIEDRDSYLIEKLDIMHRQSVINAYVTKSGISVWDKLSNFRNKNKKYKVFLSRSRFNKRNNSRSIINEQELDQLMLKNGFSVLYPEELSIENQIEIIANSMVLCGVSGSSLHLSAFCQYGSTIIELGDMRTYKNPLPNQVVIDAAKEHKSLHVAYDKINNRFDLYTIDEIIKSL